MVESFKNSMVDLIRIIDNFSSSNLTPVESAYEVWLNHFLIKTYTSYERYNKTLLSSLKQRVEAEHQFLPIVVNHKPINEKFVAPTKSEEILRLFPLLKYSYYYQENKGKIDAIISGRNKYAHEGAHQLTLEVICNSLLWIQYTVRFINTYYSNLGLKSKGELLEEFLQLENSFLKDCESCLKVITDFSNSTSQEIPIDIQGRLISLKELYNEYISKRESLGLNSIDFEISIEIEQNIFNDDFEKQSSSEVLGSLKAYKEKLFLKLFGTSRIDDTVNNYV